PVGFSLFFCLSHGFRSRCSLHPWLFYAASPFGEALNLARLTARITSPNFNLWSNESLMADIKSAAGGLPRLGE
ncbi:MAG: hypothetical protein IJB33_01790, partial [Akkermansia sp.]|nr:hypothetical protein [Akkermansia sp.]